MTKLNYIKNLFYYLAIFGLVVISAAASFSLMRISGNLKLFVVQSGSMEPAIKTGSLVAVIPMEKYRENEVITFSTDPAGEPSKSKTIISHRIVSVLDQPGRISYQVKGDANRTVDPEPVLPKQILGKAVFSIPFLGYPVAFAKTQTGLIVLIVIPATLIVYGELLNIKKEIAGLWRKYKEKRKNASIYNGFVKLSVKAAVLIVLISLFLVKSKNLEIITWARQSIAGGSSGFYDSETASLSISAGVWSSPAVNFSLSEDKQSVAFEAKGVSGFDNLNYVITYQAGDLPRGIGPADIANPAHEDTISRDNLTLGSCTSEGHCTYDTDIGKIHLKVTLSQTGEADKIIEKEIAYE